MVGKVGLERRRAQYVKVGEEGRVKAEESLTMHFILERCAAPSYVTLQNKLQAAVKCIQCGFTSHMHTVCCTVPQLLHLKQHTLLHCSLGANQN